MLSGVKKLFRMKENKGTKESRKIDNALPKSLSLVYRNEARQNELGEKQGPE